MLRIRLFGEFKVKVNGKKVKVESQTQGDRLLAYFCLHYNSPDSELRYGTIARRIPYPDLPDSPDHHATARAVYNLRQALGDYGWILGAPHQTRRLNYNGQPGVEVDLIKFDKALQAGDLGSLLRASRIYKAPVLNGWDDPSRDQKWVTEYRDQIEKRFWTAWERLDFKQIILSGKWRLVMSRIRSAICMRSRHNMATTVAEEVFSKCLRSLGEARMFQSALDEIKAFSHQIGKVGLVPSPEIILLQEEIENRKQDFEVSDVAGNIPDIWHNEFVSRPGEFEALKELILKPQIALVTLVGRGGVGKSRLAYEIGKILEEEFYDRVWVVKLDEISLPGEVAEQVANALHLRKVSATPYDTLIKFLKRKRLLLILDNCEHLVSECNKLSKALTAHCPGIKILATSRQSLGILYEEVRYVRPLDFPGEGEATAGDLRLLMLQYPAIKLFVDRARKALPSFQLLPDNIVIVAEICRRLNGLPKAIELAAAQITKLGLQGILNGLKNIFSLLVSSDPTAKLKDRAMSSCLEWGHELLSPLAQQLLRRLSIFSGGWTIEALAAICGDLGDESQLQTLQQELIDKSWGERVGATTRCRLFDVIREFAFAKLSESGEAETITSAHLAYFLKLAEEVGVGVFGPTMVDCLTRLQDDFSNLKAAMNWALDNDPIAGFEICGHLWSGWAVQGYLIEGRERIAEFVKLYPQAKIQTWAKVLCGDACLAYFQSDYSSASAAAEQSLAFSKLAKDPWLTTLSLIILGVCQFHEARAYDSALSHFRESVQIAEETRSPWLLSLALGTLAVHFVYRSGVRGAAEKSLSPADLSQVLEMAEESVRLALQTQNPWIICVALVNQGVTLCSVHPTRYVDQAEELFKKSLALRHECGDKYGLIQSLGRVAGTACAKGRFRRAAILLGVQDALTADRQIPIPRIDLIEREETVKALQDYTEFMNWRQHGTEMELKDAVKYALTGTP